ncbi:MAG: magnesium transporter CorA family protein [Firmicutes bacterium]|nr:magnesium transporter CorA family protein [Bacillota bacterium]
MIEAFITVNDRLEPVQNLTEKGVWINLINPSDTELYYVSTQTGAGMDLLKTALDEEERSRIEVDSGHLLILINIPVVADSSARLLYDTLPLGIIVSSDFIVTICLKDNPIIDEMEYSKDPSFHTFKHTRFVLQILFKTAYYYLRYLKHIDRKSGEIEALLHKSMKNEELLKLLDLEKSLVFFTTSLKANEIVMEKLLRVQLRASRKSDDPDLVATSQILQMYPDDEDLLEDVITENKQAMEMCQTYSDILSGMMDAFASIISNNLNIVMKFLTSITIIMALPTMVASFFGMNVAIPFQESPYGFLLIIAISILLSATGFILLKRRNMF